MKHTVRKRLLALLCCGVMLLCGCVKNKPDEPGSSDVATGSGEQPAVPVVPSALTSGIGFSVSDAESRKLDTGTTASLIGFMKFSAVGTEEELANLVTPDGGIRTAKAASYHRWFAAMRENGVKDILFTVTGCLWESGSQITDRNAFPYPDYETDSVYYRFLERYRNAFAALAREFPEVTCWQAGKALNQNENAHPSDYGTRGTVFVAKDKAGLAADLAHAAKTGIGDAGKNTPVAIASVSAADGYRNAADHLEAIYKYLSSGRSPYGVLTPADCFDLLAWSPDMCWYAFDTENFLSGNEQLRQVAVRYGDEEKRVLLNGFGFCDYGSRAYDTQQSAWIADLYAAVAEQMPYVCALYPDQFFEGDDTSQDENIYSGMFRVFGKDSFGAKEKAKALCNLNKGENGRLDTYIKGNTVYTEIQQSGNARNGIGFAVKGAEERNLNIDKIMDLLRIMNVQCMRNWMNIRTLLTSPTQINEHEVELQKQWIAQLNRRGITKIVGMSQGSFWPRETNIQDPLAAPYRDLEEGSLYREFLDAYEQSWYTLASTFPEIGYWEVGNETNSDNFLHPLTFSQNSAKFTLEEKALITADMTYTAAKGVKRANPDAVIIFPGMAPLSGFSSLSNFLEKVYSVIEAGKCIGGSDPDSYFDAVAWHCYYFRTSFTPENWLEGNNQVYQVMVNHGDGDKKVFLTEFGFSDGGNEQKDAQQAAYFKEIYRLAETEMPYIDSLYPFRTIEDETAAEWGGTIEIYYGMFRVFDTEHFGAKEKAKAICEIYGGDLTALNRYSGGKSVYPR